MYASEPLRDAYAEYPEDLRSRYIVPQYLKDEEKDLGLTATVIARDGIAVIVNKDNDVDELTSDQVKAVYTGETTTWEDLAK